MATPGQRGGPPIPSAMPIRFSTDLDHKQTLWSDLRSIIVKHLSTILTENKEQLEGTIVVYQQEIE